MSGAYEVNQMTDKKPEQTLSRKCNLQLGSDLNERVALEAEEPHEPMIMLIIKQRGLVKASRQMRPVHGASVGDEGSAAESSDPRALLRGSSWRIGDPIDTA